MEFLRKLVLQTQNHLKGLTRSQRLAIGSCVALIFVSLLWLVQWGARPELVPLLDQPISAAELTPIEQRLATLGVEYKRVNDVVMVPADARPRLLAQLSETRALPQDISLGFTKLIDQSNMWMSGEEQGRRWTIALANELAKVIREFDGVEEAQVFIDRNTRRTVTGPPVTPTASVFVKQAPGIELTRERTFAIASLVKGAVAGLDITKVAVTDARTRRSQSVPGPDDTDDAGDDLANRQKKEEYFANKIRELLANIPGVLVAVHAELDPEARKTTRQEYDKPVTVTEKTESSTSEKSTRAGGPGVVPNTSQAIGSSGVVERTEKSTSDSKYETKLKTMVTSDQARYGIKSLAASVNVPRSYLAAIYKSVNAGKEPSDAELKPLAQVELKKITGLVRTALAIKDDSDAVAVEFFHDEALAKLGGVSEAMGTGGDIMTLFRLYGGKAGLGALGAFSLMMMLMMVRKVSEGPVLPGEEPPKQVIRIINNRKRQESEAQTETLTVNTPPVGEAEAREQLLVGREVDESTLHIQQVVDQLADMVKVDPRTSAEILQRWIESEKQ